MYQNMTFINIFPMVILDIEFIIQMLIQINTCIDNVRIRLIKQLCCMAWYKCT